MRKNSNINMKGDTNVKSGSDEAIFDSSKAEVIRDESRWDAFQLVGDTNMEEMQHKSVQLHPKSEAEMQKILDRGMAFRIGQKVKMVMSAQSANRHAEIDLAVPVMR